MTTQQQCFLKGCSRCEWRRDERGGGSTFFERPRDIFQFTFKRRSTQGGSYGEKGFLLLRIVKNLELCSYKLEGHLIFFLSKIILMIRYNTGKGKNIYSGQSDHMFAKQRWTEDHSHRFLEPIGNPLV